jgi:hypothetical protein
VTSTRFALPGFRGEAGPSFAVADPAAEARRLLDPAVALETLHWGRNYLYRARVESRDGALDVVVKQFRDARSGPFARRRAGARAARSWAVARALAAAGFETPEPLLLLEPEGGGGTALFVTRWLGGRSELRYWLRARNAGRDGEEFPAVDAAALLGAVARLARRLHDAGFWFRDFSIGNLLVDLAAAGPGGEPAIALVDLNRCRQLARVPTGARLRDLARLPLVRAVDRALLLAAYFAPAAVPALVRPRYELYQRSFHGRHRWKRRLRGGAARVRAWLVPRGVHAHIPPPPAAAAVRDKVVWDRLSDQPHQHAGRLERAWVRLADLPDHLRTIGAAAAAAPRVRGAYRRLAAERNRAPFAWPAAGVALRPDPERAEALLAAFDALGLGRALVRLHPWAAEHADEEALARALAARGVELAFALPQNRELVRDRARWRAAVAELAERFAPLGAAFQIGQAINRSKWGVWNYGEYLELAGEAAAILRRVRPDVLVVGPAVIDFELHATAAVVNRRHPTLRFDALASLLYVDRRGAPENRQLGFDTVDKVTLAAAIAETGRLVGRRASWVTEVNWPLREGPHSPAGRSVSVDEETQADYLARFYLLAQGSGYVERVYWWQLAARGYGLADPQPDGTLRRRPGFAALATLERELAGTACHGPQPAPAGTRLYRFTRAGGGELWAGWSLAGARRAALPAAPVRGAGRSGEPLPLPAGAEVELLPAVRYFELPAARG